MTPQQLRSSILQLAIQGRLVEQRPEEGTGAELLREISTQRRRDAEAKGKSKVAKSSSRQAVGSRPSVVLPEDAPFEIPESWVWVLLPQAVDILYGFPFDSQQFNSTGEGVPLIRIRDILPSKTNTFTIELCPRRYMIHNGDMLVGMDGNFNVAFWQGGDAFLNRAHLRFRPSPQSLNFPREGFRGGLRRMAGESCSLKRPSATSTRIGIRRRASRREP